MKRPIKRRPYRKWTPACPESENRSEPLAPNFQQLRHEAFGLRAENDLLVVGYFEIL